MREVAEGSWRIVLRMGERGVRRKEVAGGRDGDTCFKIIKDLVEHIAIIFSI